MALCDSMTHRQTGGRTDGLIIHCWQVRARWLAAKSFPSVTINHRQTTITHIAHACHWRRFSISARSGTQGALWPYCDPSARESWRHAARSSDVVDCVIISRALASLFCVISACRYVVSIYHTHHHSHPMHRSLYRSFLLLKAVKYICILAYILWHR